MYRDRGEMVVKCRGKQAERSLERVCGSCYRDDARRTLGEVKLAVEIVPGDVEQGFTPPCVQLGALASEVAYVTGALFWKHP